MNFRLILRIVLTIGFLVAVGNSIYTWMLEDTYLSIEYDTGNIPIPSITICPYIIDTNYPRYAKGGNKTLTQLIDEIEPFRNSIMEATFIIGDEFKVYNNVTDLLKGGIFTDIVRPGANNLLMRCSIIDMPALDFRFKNYVTFSFMINMANYTTIVAERHERGMSTMTYLRNWRFIASMSRNDNANRQLEALKLVRTSKVAHDKCSSENDVSLINCMHRFTESKLGCNLPWLERKSNMRLCDQVKDLDNFSDLFRNFTYDEITEEELKEFGCLTKNCESNTWEVLSNEEPKPIDLPSNHAFFQYYIASGVATKVTREHLSYGIANFVADCGGYLGLLLGASLLSIYDGILDFTKAYQDSMKLRRKLSSSRMKKIQG